MSWLRQSVGFATLAFITMVLFIVLSNPYDMLIDTVEDESQEYIEQDTIDSSIAPFLNTLRMVFGLVFVLSMVGLVLGIFLKSHESEYEEYPEDYRRM